MPKGKHEPPSKPVLDVYEAHPPEWLPVAHGSADLGYTGFHPPRPGQDEDSMSEPNVRNGISSAAEVQAETWSAQDPIKSRFADHNALVELENLMNEVFARKADHAPPIPTSSFRLPTRVTLNDTKRQAWFADLANPDVPLHKLGKSVPHGAKGHDLLDLLHTNNVAIPRAVFFLRAFGANETASLRNRPSYNPMQYSIEWANVVTSYLKKQLAEITLPSAPRVGLNIKSTFKGVLSEADARDKWISRFVYCTQLLRTFYSEGLVDHRVFLTWLVQQLQTCNLAQAAFVARLAEEFLDGMLASRALTRPFVEACLMRLSEVQTSSAQGVLVELEGSLKKMVQSICLALPDALVSPKLWITHFPVLTEVLTSSILDQAGGQIVQQNADELEQSILANFMQIKGRNEALLLLNLPSRAPAQLGRTVADIQLLNSISSTTDMSSLQFLEPGSSESDTRSKIETLLTWSTTPLQYGKHRPYAAVTILRNWRTKAEERATRRDATPPDEFLQDRLFEWLDKAPVAGDPGNIRRVAMMFGKFVKYDLFSYPKYIQRLIARGEAVSSESDSRHRDFLRCTPIHQSTPSLLNQRKVALYGTRTRVAPEAANEKEMRNEIRAIMPELFSNDVTMSPAQLSNSGLLASCPTLLNGTRFEQVHTFGWLLPVLKNHVALCQRDENVVAPGLFRIFGMSVELMDQAQCHSSMLELCLFTLQLAKTNDVLTALIETYHRFSTIWNAMDESRSITMALYAAHQHWKLRSMQSRALLALLMESDRGVYLDSVAREQILADVTAYTHALYPRTEIPEIVPAAIGEILMLANDPRPEAPSVLASSLWYRYRTAHDWGLKVWDNTVASLSMVSSMATDQAGRRECALRYGTFILQVDHHLPSGIDGQIHEWFVGAGQAEVAGLSNDAWDLLMVLMMFLSVHGALGTTTILEGLVYPTWTIAASAVAGHHHDVLFRAVNDLVDGLLIREDGNEDGVPPADILDVQRIRTRRQPVYREPHFSLLVATIPTLVMVEHNVNLGDDLRGTAMSLRLGMCGLDDFRQGTNRNLEAVRDAFEQPLGSSALDPRLSEPTTTALRLLLSNRPTNLNLDGFQDFSTLLSPWKLSATAIEMQFSLRQMGRGLSHHATRVKASDELDKLTNGIFAHSLTSEEAYFVAEMANGADTAVAGKFINNGLKRVVEILKASTELENCIPRAGEVLRILAHVAQPLRTAPELVPELEVQVQDGLFAEICYRMSLLAASSTDKYRSYAEGTIFIARLLQFDIGLRGAWTVKTKEMSAGLLESIGALVLNYGTGDNADCVACPLLLDTLYYLLDEIPSDPRNPVFEPFRNYPKLSPTGIPKDISPSFRRQLESLRSDLPVNSTVAGLASGHRDANGMLVIGAPVVNRPWDWIENIGEPAAVESKDHVDSLEPRRPTHPKELVKNSGSISLSSFGARITGDAVLDNNCQDSQIASNTRSFEDGLSSESVFQRDWRETRVDLMEPVLAENRGHDYPSSAPIVPVPSRQSSPGASVRSRTSGQGSSNSRRASPAQFGLNRLSTSTVSEIIDLEMDSVTTTAPASTSRRAPKRKVPVVVSDDDEIEIIDGPAPVSSKHSKRPKAAVAKPRARKR